MIGPAVAGGWSQARVSAEALAIACRWTVSIISLLHFFRWRKKLDSLPASLEVTIPEKASLDRAPKG
jgi:hypothetical protein